MAVKLSDTVKHDEIPVNGFKSPADGSTNVMFSKETRLDLSYIITLSGLLKCIVIVLDFLILICILASPFRWNGRGIYFLIIVTYGFCFSGILLILYLFHLVEKYHNVKWLKVEMISYLILTVLYLLASTIAVAFGADAYSAAGFFGYLAMVCYGIDAFLKGRALNAGELAQGHHVMTKRAPVSLQA